ncbi:MAG TPA: hypothetical protein VIU40_13220, partial [Geobacteraceae bacterium]
PVYGPSFSDGYYKVTEETAKLRAEEARKRFESYREAALEKIDALPTWGMTERATRAFMKLGKGWRIGNFTITGQSLLGLYAEDNQITLSTMGSGIPSDARVLDMVADASTLTLRIIFASQKMKADGMVFNPSFEVTG